MPEIKHMMLMMFFCEATMTYFFLFGEGPARERLKPRPALRKLEISMSDIF